MPATPDIALATHLATANGLTLGTSAFYGPALPPGTGTVADKAIFVVSRGGAVPRAFYGQATALKRARLSVRVRADAQDYDGGLVFARAVLQSGDRSTIAGYVDTRAQQTEPTYFGMDDEGHHEWGVDFEMIYEE